MNHTQSGIIMYQSIYKADENGISMPLFYNPETKKYIEMRYAYVTNNWSLRDGAEGYGTRHSYYEAV